MKEEYDALMKNGTWSLVPRASTTNVVDGFSATTKVIDFHEAFSPVVKSTTIRAVLSLAVTNDWPLRQLGNNKGTIDNIICQLGSAFALKDLGPLNYFLVWKMFRMCPDISLSQKKYMLEYSKVLVFLICNPSVFSPMVTRVHSV
ncbi:uncharacterized mitochondrial protein-like protein isoform X2 [Tanacetum coccineum]